MFFRYLQSTPVSRSDCVDEDVDLTAKIEALTTTLEETNTVIETLETDWSTVEETWNTQIQNFKIAAEQASADLLAQAEAGNFLNGSSTNDAEVQQQQQPPQSVEARRYGFLIIAAD